MKTVDIQVRWAAAHLCTRPSAPECGDTLLALAGDQRPIKGGDRLQKEDGSGSLSTGSPDGRTPPHGDGSRYSQANVKGRKGAAVPYPKRCCGKRMGPKKCDSTEESLLRVERCSPWGAPRQPVCEPVRSPKNTRAHSAKAGTESFEPRVHCLEVSSRAKAVENCPSTIVPTLKRLQLFFAQLPP